MFIESKTVKNLYVFKTGLMISLLVFCCFIRQSLAHGRLEIPASRNSAWRFGFKTPENYNDNELNCGGAGVQHSTNGGKCGICGDSYSGTRFHEAGGKFATGTIVKSYTSGQMIDVRVRLSANHKGTMEFRLCPVNSKYVEATLECLNKNLMQIQGYGTAYPVKTGESEINLNVKLPDGVTCSQCVFQWKYRAGNNWGSLPNGTSGPGIGPQEEFYNCADVEIKSTGSNVPVTQKTTTKALIPSTTFRMTTTPSIITTKIPTTTIPIIIKSTTKYVTNNVVIEPFFHCQKMDPLLAASLPKTPDQNEFNGIPLCLLIGDSILTCKDCYENCISPFKVCPKQYCYCRWYN